MKQNNYVLVAGIRDRGGAEDVKRTGVDENLAGLQSPTPVNSRPDCTTKKLRAARSAPQSPCSGELTTLPTDPQIFPRPHLDHFQSGQDPSRPIFPQVAPMLGVCDKCAAVAVAAAAGVFTAVCLSAFISSLNR